jgi:hypothetical protein
MSAAGAAGAAAAAGALSLDEKMHLITRNLQEGQTRGAESRRRALECMLSQRRHKTRMRDVVLLQELLVAPSPPPLSMSRSHALRPCVLLLPSCAVCGHGRRCGELVPAS